MVQIGKLSGRAEVVVAPGEEIECDVLFSAW